jgi:hypothetical protein
MSNIHVERPYNRKDVTDDKIKRLINDPTFPPKYFSLQASVYGIEDTHERDFGEVLVYGRPSDLAANEDYERLLNRVKGLAKLVKKRLAPIIKLMESVVGQPIDFITTRDKKKKCDMCRYFISVQRDLCYRCDELKGKRAPRDRTERDQNPAQKRKLPNHQTDQKLSSAQKEGNKARGNNTAQREAIRKFWASLAPVDRSNQIQAHQERWAMLTDDEKDRRSAALTDEWYTAWLVLTTDEKQQHIKALDNGSEEEWEEGLSQEEKDRRGKVMRDGWNKWWNEVSEEDRKTYRQESNKRFKALSKEEMDGRFKAMRNEHDLWY